MGLLRAIVLTAIAVGGCTAQEVPLETKWRSLQVNCSSSSPSRRRHDQVSLSDATVLFEDLGLSPASRSRWLHDLGEWHLLRGGNISRSEEFLRTSADMGQASAQFLVGVLAATDATASPAESAVFYQFAASGGSIPAAMALGYRHLVGYHAPRSCETALRYYKTVADDVMRHGHALPNRAVPIQVFSMPTPTRLSDDQTKLPQTDNVDRDRVEYLRHRAASSLASIELLVRTASLILFSDLYQDTTMAHEQAQRDAINLLERAARLSSTSANALLGHVHAYGLAGARVNKARAIQLYEDAYNSSNASVNGKAEAANGLGLLYFHGQPSDVERAMSYFQSAARSGHADGVFNAANVMARVDPQRTIQYLQAAVEVGHVGAMFKLARTKEKQRFENVVGDDESGCMAAVNTYKQVAEHHQFGRALFKRAEEAFLSGHYEHALRLNRIAAELGFEVAEHNAAWLLERYVFSSTRDVLKSSTYVQLVKRGIVQHSADAVVRRGDMEFTKGNYRLAMKQYLRAMEMDPTHARALYSAGYMCEWGLGTIHNGRNLERARWYYEQTQRHEPLLAYALPVVILRIDMELMATHWNNQIRRLYHDAFRWIKTVFVAPVPHDTKHGEIVFDDATVTTPTTVTPVQFVSAMAFDGVTSSVTVETTQPSPLHTVTLETWLWIEKPPNHASASGSTSQVLFEWPSILRVELIPHHDRVSWQIRVSGYESYQSVLTLTNAVFRPQRWYRITIMVDATRRKVELRVNGEVADTGNLLVSFPTSTHGRSVVHVGHSSRQPQQDATNVFHGQLVEYQVWRGVSAAHDTSESAQMRPADRSMWIHLLFDVHARGDGASGRDHDQIRVLDRQGETGSQVTVSGVEHRMVQFPLGRH